MAHPRPRGPWPVIGALVWLGLALAPALGSAADATRLQPETYERLTQIFIDLELGQTEEAVQALESLRDRSLRPYDRAIVRETLGHAYAQRGDYRRAAEAFEAALEPGILGAEKRAHILFQLGQMQFATERSAAAADTLARYLQAAEEPKHEAWRLLAQARFDLGRWRGVEEAIDALLRRSDAPDADWYRLKLAAQLERGAYRAAAKTLEAMIQRWPDRRTYWRDLASVYRQADQPAKALAVRELMYARGLITEPSAIRDLARLAMAEGRPFRAGEILSQALERGQLRATVDTLDLLARAWQLARETDKAEAVLARAAAKARDGQLHLRLARLQYEDEDWQSLAESAQKALDQGGLDRPGQAALLLGIARFRQGETQAARAAFQRAQSDASTRQDAASWLEYLKRQATRETTAGSG